MYNLCCVRKMEHSKIVENGIVQIKNKRRKQKCDICDLWVNGNNISNHRKLHSPPNIKCAMCDFSAYYHSQVDYHYNRIHVHKIKQGRPIGKKAKLGHIKPRIFTKKVLSDLKTCDSPALIEQIPETQHQTINEVTHVLDDNIKHKPILTKAAQKFFLRRSIRMKKVECRFIFLNMHI